ncbi:MAG: hypothetical protein O2923_07025 [Verrucomicrobia bacterium]|nr:hypothetical protein [Verrucomicrobiota bacterium]MDA1086188.1 hypothetical protein [Verrucomicrobiota bacterium]
MTDIVYADESYAIMGACFNRSYSIAIRIIRVFRGFRIRTQMTIEPPIYATAIRAIRGFRAYVY